MDQATLIAADERPLWRQIYEFPLVAMLIAITLVMAATAAAVLIVQFVLPPLPGLGRQLTLDLVAIPLLILVYKLAIRLLGEHPRDDLRAPRALRLLGIGLGAGFLIFTLAVAIAAVIGVYRVTGEGDTSGLLDALLAAAIFPAISEEMLFRGILFRWIEEFGGSWVGLALSALAFGFAHYFNPDVTAVACLEIALEAGVMLGAAYMLTRSLWLPIGIHAAWNFAQGEIYGIPVSGTKVHGLLHARLSGPPLLTGNGFGLEASIIAVVVATVFGLWLLWLAVRRGQLVSPLWVRRRA
jgi:hypothetical protein